VRSLVADHDEPLTFFCGGSRNFSKISDLFDGVFILDVDLDTSLRRLARRPEGEFGGKQSERDFFAARLYPTTEDIPQDGIVIDTSRPVEQVVDEILRHAEAAPRCGRTG
jgi:thymidylate kinase